MFSGIIGLLSALMAVILGWFTVQLAVMHWYTIVLVVGLLLAVYLVVCQKFAKGLKHRAAYQRRATAPVDLDALRAAQTAKTDAWRARQAEIASERAAARTAARATANNARFAGLEEDL